MSIRRKLCWACVVLVATVSGALAWSGPLSAPSFAAPTDCPPAVMNQVSAALNRRDAKFLGGRFFGAFSHFMRYGGDTKDLNGMLADLAACPGLRLSVGFATNFTEAADWTVSNSFSATNFIFRVQVNLRSDRLRLEELVIPEAKGPPLPK